MSQEFRRLIYTETLISENISNMFSPPADDTIDGLFIVKFFISTVLLDQYIFSFPALWQLKQPNLTSFDPDMLLLPVTVIIYFIITFHIIMPLMAEIKNFCSLCV